MKTYISDLIPRLGKFSKQLANVTLLTDQHWVAVDVSLGEKRTYIFRRNNELLLSTNGQVNKGKWEIIGADSLLLDVGDTSLLLRHGFFDENILALKLDSKDEYAIFVNESKFDGELNSIQAIDDFLKEKYFDKQTAEPRILNNEDLEDDVAKSEKRMAGIVIAITCIIGVLLFIYYVATIAIN